MQRWLACLAWSCRVYAATAPFTTRTVGFSVEVFLPVLLERLLASPVSWPLPPQSLQTSQESYYSTHLLGDEDNDDDDDDDDDDDGWTCVDDDSLFAWQRQV